ncbi:hypothetical protein F3Y22_tig00111506pilonHSYRG00160 [Hibiscus syriacus]|uniref:Disease resistance R13L4/SHOC-2-like LRR domain-containing protein n=1 Tax=Hibiscus syriacus TaxID=106335 RepID=A0A6A2XPU2_HIBSY|nr:hypothetical protein F3Y22_tig00111506pilonHSYRG00160 [Hibiscus syriacus]
MKSLPALKVLDISGATRIKEIFFDCFDGTDNLRFLDLSGTNIRFLPESLGKHLCRLTLKGCSKLEKLLNSQGLTDLQALDLSNSSALQKFPDDFFVNLTSLQSLDLSNSEVKCFPSLSNLGNLRKLLLKGCSFERLPESKTFGSFEGLTNLEELDLSDCKSQAEQLPSLEGLNKLKIIKLSEAPDFKISTKICELDLRGTSSLNLKGIDFEALSRPSELRRLRLSKVAFDCIGSYLANLKQLEVLDLSGEAVESLPSFLSSFTDLKQLLLKGCSSLKELQWLKSLSQLDVLDLSGTQVKNLGDEISPLRNIKNLHIPEEVAKEFKGGKNVDALPMELKLDPCCISEPSEIPHGDKKPRIVVHGVELLKSLKENSTLLESISLKNISGCWLERCNNMASIVAEADQGKWGTLEILWILNLPELKSFYDEKVQSLSFGSSIKRLYIDCCPKLETLFP